MLCYSFGRYSFSGSLGELHIVANSQVKPGHSLMLSFIKEVR